MRPSFIALTFLALVSCVTSVLVSCGKGGATSQPAPTSTNPVESKATLVLFGAPWCTTCKNDFKIIKDLLDKAPAAQKSALSVVLYVTTGAQAKDKPTQEIADKYLEFFALQGKAYPDPWRWQNFRKMVSDTLDLPGAAVLNGTGVKVKSYEAGPTTFVPTEIVQFALDQTK